MLFNSLSEPLPKCVTANARQPLRQTTGWLSALLGDDSSVSSPSTLAFQKQLLVWSLLRPRSSHSGSALQGELRLFPGALVELSGTRKLPEHGLSLSCQPRWVPICAVAAAALCLLLSTFSDSCCAFFWFSDTCCHLVIIKLSEVSTSDFLIRDQEVWQEHRGCQISSGRLIYLKYFENYFCSCYVQMMPSKAGACKMGCRLQKVQHAGILLSKWFSYKPS